MKKLKNILKIIIILVLIVLLVFVGIMIYKEIIRNKFINLLSKNDSTNYVLIQNDGTTTTTVKVKDDVLVSEDDDTYIWISESENIRIIMDKNYKLAILTENSDESFEVNSLNGNYISDYFENDNLSFKYIGEEENLYKIQFTDKSNGNITIFYIDKDTGIVKEIVENFNETEVVLTFEVTFDIVTDDDIAYPDLTGYDVGNSSSTN